jgi:hypothetical protein
VPASNAGYKRGETEMKKDEIAEYLDKPPSWVRVYSYLLMWWVTVKMKWKVMKLKWRN